MAELAQTDPETTAAEPPEPSASLAELRHEIDRIDDTLADLLRMRAALAQRVGHAKPGGPGRVALRPGREAAIIRRLLAGHGGKLPPQTLLRIWRELFAGSIAVQGSYAISVCDATPAQTILAAAHEHFGALTPMRSYRSAAQAIAEISAGTASAAVLPLPSEDEPPASAWWTALLHKDAPRIHVVALLPFWAERPEGTAKIQALVVSSVPPDASGDDVSLLGLECADDVSRARLNEAFTQSGLPPLALLLRRDGGAARALVQVAGFIAEADARLATLSASIAPPASRIVVLGAYATPLGGQAGEGPR